MLRIKPRELLRKSEKEYKQYKLDNNELKDEDIIDIMIKNPILIQRPIIIRDNLYNSYDFLLNEKYDIDINQNTLERMKNYFK